jgi:hypothetical protein
MEKQVSTSHAQAILSFLAITSEMQLKILTTKLVRLQEIKEETQMMKILETWPSLRFVKHPAEQV